MASKTFCLFSNASVFYSGTFCMQSIIEVHLCILHAFKVLEFFATPTKSATSKLPDAVLFQKENANGSLMENFNAALCKDFW